MQHSLALDKKSLARQAAYLRIAAATLADSLKSGGFRSLYRGQGIEFSGVREYLRGDDVRTIDWNVTARMGKAYVKQFEEEHELQILLIVDQSLSMFTGSKEKTKYETAAKTAAVLALAAEINASPAGAVLFDGNIGFSCAPAFGPERTQLILSQLDEFNTSETPGSALPNALTLAHKLLRRRSLVFIISDFRISNWEESLGILAQRNDVAAIRISDESDSELPEIGTVPFTDPESEQRLVLPTSSASFRNIWRNADRQRVSHWQDECLRHNVLPVSIATDDDPVRILTGFFKYRGQQH